MSNELGRIGRHSTRNGLAAAGLLMAAWYFMPTVRARRLFVFGWLALIAGVFTTDLHANADSEPGAWQWQSFIGQPTLWSYLLWVTGGVLLVETWREVLAYRRWMRRCNAPWPEEPAVPLQAPAAQPTAAPTPAPAGNAERPTLIIPPTQRRVRRGGETLSGVPIKDRRVVDPRTL